MRIGYACLALCIPDTNFKSCMMKNADEKNLEKLIAHNLKSLENLVDANIEREILLFRISSDLIPFGSSPANTLAWWDMFADRLAHIGKKIKAGGMRVSMHPGQYTVLNSPHPDVVSRAVADLEYHARVLDGLGVDASHKIILHIGGTYGDKPLAIARFTDAVRTLSPRLRRRLALENDDVSFHIGDVMQAAQALGLPVVFDTLHHTVNPFLPEKAMKEWLHAAAATWKPEDGTQKIHYSQQNPDKKPGAHSESIGLLSFLSFFRDWQNTAIDVMLEVKDKNISAAKCAYCTASPLRPVLLEREWSRYKYRVMEHDPAAYNRIRGLMHSGDVDPVAFFYEIEAALALPLLPGRQRNAAEHIWGYFAGMATPGERAKFTACLGDLDKGKSSPCKRLLYRLSEKYARGYLLHSYYFASPA